MKPFTVAVQASAGGITVSPAYVVNNYSTPCNIGIGVITSGATYTVQHTFADPFSVNLNSSVSAASWLPNATIVSATTNTDTNYAFSPTAIRLVVHAGTGEATMTLVQSGPG